MSSPNFRLRLFPLPFILHRILREQWFLQLFVLCFLVSGPDLFITYPSLTAQTVNGEIEARPAPVARRKCIGGANAGNPCNDNADCPGSSCVDRNVFNISVAVQFNASAAELTSIQNLITAGSQTLFDATDGQAEIGLAFIYNNAFGTGSDADIRIYPSTAETWWQANTGSWQSAGSVHVSINNVQSSPNPGEHFAHEFIHLVIDARDEYEARSAGCGAVTGGANCPPAGSGANACLMDQGGVDATDHTELCWGQGNSANVTDFSGGNHDATNVTEHSICRSNRSCWDQVVWSWPNSFVEPAAAPNAAANGLTVNTTQFLFPSVTTRVVLVLDESGSMNLESPTRMERLKVAANDFIALAETNTELGIVSYSDDAETTSGRQNIAIAALGATRTTWTNAITALSPGGYTNIGAGLQKAMDMITTAGGVTANTFIVLMTDGVNNRPAPQATADADLQSKIDALLAAGIPVYVTCTGTDLGLNSQCAEIAAGTGGFYVDSSDPASLPEAFADMYERCARRDAIGSYASWRKETGSDFFVEKDAESVTFMLQWDGVDIRGSMVMIDPDGITHKSENMQQGKFVRVSKPVAGTWKMQIDFTGGTPSRFIKRGYSRNFIHSFAGHVRYPSVRPGEEIRVFAFPFSNGGSVSDPKTLLKAIVIRPDGSTDMIELNDMGHNLTGGMDDDEGDGTYTGIYSKTDLKGAYQFLIKADVDGWIPSEVAHESVAGSKSAKFSREVRLSATVGDPNDVVKEPEDGKNPPKGRPDYKDWIKWIIAIIFLLILYWWYRRRTHTKG